MIVSDEQPHAVISRNMVVLGDVVFDGHLVVDGQVYGSVTGGDGTNAHVSILANGVVNGNIRVFSAVIDGCVVGSVQTTERIAILAGARVSGDVRYGLIEVQLGAIVGGRFVRGELEPSGKVVILKSAISAAE